MMDGTDIHRERERRYKRLITILTEVKTVLFAVMGRKIAPFFLNIQIIREIAVYVFLYEIATFVAIYFIWLFFNLQTLFNGFHLLDIPLEIYRVRNNIAAPVNKYIDVICTGF
jgi:hypothetical protein